MYLISVGRELLATCQEIFEQLDRFEIIVADINSTRQGPKYRTKILTS
ncbi:MAG: hypothetical protein O4861_23920 [Trichodesmium sp. St16_bin4-tuft]|nr:hypothetical protein [Trichodesmium sp. MAG_R01]MDE5078169.1 hypothetical protein [Trichodesmium sp. St2_bin6]MDE5101208.1 hypothetical protein [Trichodesmium sp. St16_bin4-tuft]MDT9340385.1 hypothetical protein [Trichodesmium erythraeum 21-75]